MQNTKSLQKPALILIHGFRGAPSGLEPIAQYLRAAGYAVYIPAISPYAGAPQLETYSPESYANFIKNYIATEQLEQPVLIGHSMGSIIASATAELFPDIISDQLFLLAPISSKPSSFFRHLAPLSSYLPLNVVDYITTRYLYAKKSTRADFSEVMTLTHECSHLLPPSRKLSNSVAKFSANYCVSDFNFKKDVTIIVGEHDTLIKRSITESLAQKLSAKTIFLSNSGHLHTYEFPKETADAILKNLKLNQNQVK